jgi:hypothetical protein
MILMSLYLVALFVALTPGVLLTLPKRGKKLTVAVVHGLVFALIWHFTHKVVWRFLHVEGFAGVTSLPKGTTCVNNAMCASNKCDGFVQGVPGKAEVKGTCTFYSTNGVTTNTVVNTTNTSCKVDSDCKSAKAQGTCKGYSAAVADKPSVDGKCA